jgi:ribose 5-phosphate isomerase B
MTRRRNSKVLRIALGSDHAGFRVKEALIKFLSSKGYRVADLGTYSEESVDYPEYAFRVAKMVSRGQADRGILACGTGIGMSIAANKVKKIRAAVVWSPKSAEMAAEHNWANVLCVSGRLSPISSVKKFVHTWLKTPFDNSIRHQRRIKKILDFESKS